MYHFHHSSFASVTITSVSLCFRFCQMGNQNLLHLGERQPLESSMVCKQTSNINVLLEMVKGLTLNSVGVSIPTWIVKLFTSISYDTMLLVSVGYLADCCVYLISRVVGRNKPFCRNIKQQTILLLI